MSDLYNIVLVPDAVLKEKSTPLEEVNDAVRSQIDRMFKTMYEAPGIGLAANQVGITNRIFVMDVPDDGWEYGEKLSDGVLPVESVYRSGKDSEATEIRFNPLVMINPEILEESDTRSVFQEGCLSIPEQFVDIVRPAQVRVRYIDYDGKQQERVFEGLPSHCVQHEIDHLNGILFVDYLSSLKRNMMIKKVAKIKKQQTVL